MGVIKLLEMLACNAHYRLKLDDALLSQNDDIRDAFLNNDSSLIKKQFGDLKLLADRSTVAAI